MVVRPEDPIFDSFADNLMIATDSMPIYSSHHRNYYYEYLNGKQTLDGFLLVDEVPYFGILCSKDISGEINGYFGLPAVVMVSPKIDLTSYSTQTNIIKSSVIEFLSKIRYKIDRKSAIFSLPFDLYDSTVMELFLSKAVLAKVQFERRIDLQAAASGPTKSLKEAMLRSKRYGITHRIYEKGICSHLEIEMAVQELKNLHIQASGRMTRSESSWREQVNAVKNGNAAVVTTYFEDKALSSALFIHNAWTSYYGVSASSPNPDLPKSHVVMKHAIEHLKKIGFKYLFLGSQYSNLTMSIGAKEKGIEGFKSLFGGQIIPSLLVEI